MSTLTPTESARINLRTSPEAKALIERAAAIMGSTVSSYMLQNAYEAAARSIKALASALVRRLMRTDSVVVRVDIS